MNSSAPAPAAAPAPAPAPDPDNETDSYSRNEIHHAEGKDVAEDLGMDEVAVIFSFLSHDDIMCSRRVCSTWKDAAKNTIVPLTTFLVNSNRSYNAMRVMTTALPNLQQITLDCFRIRHRCKYSDGEEPDEGLTQNTAHYTTHDINIISSFAKLRSLRIEASDSLNGRYPVLFNFKHLQQLSIDLSPYLKFDLDMLGGLPSLKELHLENFDGWVDSDWTGNLGALGVLKGTLEKVSINYCRRISGNFMDLADFPCLRELNLRCTAVTGDIRDISEHDFPALESFHLPNTVRGGMDYEFQSIAEVPSFMQAMYRLLQWSPELFGVVNLRWSLSTNSRDWYDSEEGNPSPPFDLQFVKAGSRLGWSWCSSIWDWDDDDTRMGAVCDESCEINWLDPEPSSESSDHDAYIQKLRLIQRGVDFYRGYHQPPNELEYRRLCEGLP